METCLFDHHLKLRAKVTNFEGFEMPIQYEGALKEHDFVRNHCGLFDISHMAKIDIEGIKSEAFLDYISVNDVTRLADHQAQYTVLCNSFGMSLDDVLIYRRNQTSYFMVVNASNRDKDFKHLKKFGKKYGVKITPNFREHGILALQGPNSKEVLKAIYPEIENLNFMEFLEKEVTISRTGYTGELGYEIYGENSQIIQLWEKLLADPQKVKPIGLAARDILRLEMGYALYGHELSEKISPIESVAKWVVKLNKPSFLGKEAIEKIKNSPQKRKAYAIILSENAIARANTEVYINNEKKGVVTSGIYSPSLKRSIALTLLQEELKENDRVQVLLRGRMIDAEVTSLPFLKK